MAAAPWATAEQAAELTGASVDETARNLAANAIELHTGLIESVERKSMADRDRYWLKLAVCYQAAWLVAQPDYLERNAVASVSQDGQSASAGNPDWLTLAPLARKALRRLSWRGTRTMVVGADARLARVRDVLSESYDDSHAWRRM